jgi:hypothetical protein
MPRGHDDATDDQNWRLDQHDGTLMSADAP